MASSSTFPPATESTGLYTLFLRFWLECLLGVVARRLFSLPFCFCFCDCCLFKLWDLFNFTSLVYYSLKKPFYSLELFLHFQALVFLLFWVQNLDKRCYGIWKFKLLSTLVKIFPFTLGYSWVWLLLFFSCLLFFPVKTLRPAFLYFILFL